jgi:hypothetical protein
MVFGVGIRGREITVHTPCQTLVLPRHGLAVVTPWGEELDERRIVLPAHLVIKRLLPHSRKHWHQQSKEVCSVCKAKTGQVHRIENHPFRSIWTTLGDPQGQSLPCSPLFISSRKAEGCEANRDNILDVILSHGQDSAGHGRHKARLGTSPSSHQSHAPHQTKRRGKAVEDPQPGPHIQTAPTPFFGPNLGPCLPPPPEGASFSTTEFCWKAMRQSL